jgi:hypothetical protein
VELEDTKMMRELLVPEHCPLFPSLKSQLCEPLSPLDEDDHPQTRLSLPRQIFPLPETKRLSGTMMQFSELCVVKK